jgi:hypothetical protein
VGGKFMWPPTPVRTPHSVALHQGQAVGMVLCNRMLAQAECPAMPQGLNGITSLHVKLPLSTLSTRRGAAVLQESPLFFSPSKFLLAAEAASI